MSAAALYAALVVIALLVAYVAFLHRRLRIEGDTSLALGDALVANNAAVNEASEVVEALDDKLAKHRKAASYWERRFWSLHEAIEGLLGERDGWQQKYEDSAHKMLEGQAQLTQNLIKARAKLHNAIAIINQERSRRREAVELLSDAETATMLDEALNVLGSPGDNEPIERVDITGPPADIVAKFFDHIRETSKRAQEELETSRATRAERRAGWREHVAELASAAKDEAPGDGDVQVLVDEQA